MIASRMNQTVLVDIANPKDKLIVALDVETVDEAREIVAALRGLVGMFKIGPYLFTSAGPSLVREIVKAGERVFLDLKFHDIPAVVAAAGREAARLGVSLFTVHASGGSEMMRRVSESVSTTVEREGGERTRVLGVTVLTSSDAATLKEIGIRSSIEEQVAALAHLAENSGLDGVVASPREILLTRLDRGFAPSLGMRPLGCNPARRRRFGLTDTIPPRC